MEWERGKTSVSNKKREVEGNERGKGQGDERGQERRRENGRLLEETKRKNKQKMGNFNRFVFENRSLSLSCQDFFCVSMWTGQTPCKIGKLVTLINTELFFQTRFFLSWFWVTEFEIVFRFSPSIGFTKLTLYLT